MTLASKAIDPEDDKQRRHLHRHLRRTFDPGKLLFESEIEISRAYCDALFEAGVLSRLEAEKIKSGLQTMLKRAGFDPDYFNKPEADDIFGFIDRKLCHLVGEAGRKTGLGRTPAERQLTALRLALGREITRISGQLRETQELFVSSAENEPGSIFFIRGGRPGRQTVLYAHWCLSHFETLKGDRERLDEVWRRVHTLPLGSYDGSGTVLEFGREELAAKLGFQRITANSIEALRNLDFTLEFINAAVIVSVHLIDMIGELERLTEEELLRPGPAYDRGMPGDMAYRLQKMQTYQTRLNATLLSSGAERELRFWDCVEIIFEASDLLGTCIGAFNLINRGLRPAREKIDELRAGRRASVDEIKEYLVQRNESLEDACRKAARIGELWVGRPEVTLEDLRAIAPGVTADIFELLRNEGQLENKDLVGGTAPERVREALAEARMSLRYEE